MAMTSDKAEWCAFGIWLDRVGLCSSTLFCASGSTFDSVITEKLSSPQHFTNNFPWMFLVSFCRTCSGISFCVNTWARYQIFPCLAQTMSSPLTHSVFYFVLVFFLFTVVCLWLSVIVVVMKIINVITFFRLSSCSSDDLFIGQFRFRKAIFAHRVHFNASHDNSSMYKWLSHTTKLCTRWILVFPVYHVLCQEFFSNF